MNESKSFASLGPTLLARKGAAKPAMRSQHWSQGAANAAQAAETLEDLGDRIREVQPEVFPAVPRLLEKIYDKIVAKGEDLTGIKRKLFFWALDLGLRYEVHGTGAWYDLQLKLARKLIFSKWKEALGGNVRVIASGSAALQPRLARVFSWT